MRGYSRWWASAIMALTTGAAQAQTSPPDQPAAVYAVRADPALAGFINQVLYALAARRPAAVTLAASGAWVREDCAGRPAVPAGPPRLELTSP